MRLHRLKLLNFRQHASTEIVFGTGITAIIGPNGSGKTTLLEAIAWAFYGNPAARGSRDSIRWNRAPARASVRVEVEFSLGAHEFRVGRGLYSAELFQDRLDAPTVVGHQEVSGRLERLLGMTRDEFFNTYFTGQKELAVMAALGPTDRARFLSRVLGYEKLRLAQDQVRETRSGLRGELTGLERGLADAEVLASEHAEAKAQLAEVQGLLDTATRTREEATTALELEGPVWTRMAELRESVLEFEGELRIAERDVGEARREFERLDKELAEALAARTEFAGLESDLSTVAPLREELETLERQARAAGQRRSLAGRLREVEGQLQRERERAERFGDVDAALTSARSALDVARVALGRAEVEEEAASTAWVRDRQDAETKRQNLRDQYVDVQKHRESVVAAGAEDECPICKRPLGAVYQEVLETLHRQMEEIEVKGKFFKRRTEQLKQPPDELGATQAAVKAARTAVEEAAQLVARCEDRRRQRHDVESDLERLASRQRELHEEMTTLPETYDSDRHDQVRESLRALEPTITRAAELRSAASKAEDLVGRAEAAERTASECEAKVKGLETAIADLGFSEEAFTAARERYQAAEATLRETELRLASVQGDVRAAEAALTSAERRLREREERVRRIDVVRTDFTLHDELDRALHDLRLELNARMRPELAERASDLLGDLTDSRYNEVELDESYRLLLVEDGQVKPVISGGEEDLLHLVLRLAISQMVAERAGQPLSLLVLDEIFGSLDEHRRQNVVSLLRGLADRFPQVVLITHIESVREGVDRALRVDLDSETGASLVREDPTTLEGADVAA
ncbi:MAG: SMC family ATPase [Gemmatimonadota bacterium]|nr:SMC family ATPase [Gemmatimonadota bacterium]MDH3367095.1 SMC family ATPase [Gemmatimonadota bacterium]MDH3477717.1 SMC family ATPase [Gemmatimonadota bacterium]MDH3569976.1 SMC family ATPase [Gemmatimonadota bacterium]MDH5549278.1 SMC family ATPase [Gemmatimonadota bacterium]